MAAITVSTRAKRSTARSPRKNFSRAFCGSNKRAVSLSGLNHIVEVLTGGRHGSDSAARSQRAFDLRHRSRHQTRWWQAIGRELLRLGLVEVAPGKFATLQVTAAGRTALRGRTPITLTKQVEKPPAKVKQRAGEIECDEALFAHLRGVRRTLSRRAQRAGLCDFLRRGFARNGADLSHDSRRVSTHPRCR